MKCLICGGDGFECIHKGTRDFPQINVMKCQECGMVHTIPRKIMREGAC